MTTATDDKGDVLSQVIGTALPCGTKCKLILQNPSYLNGSIVEILGVAYQYGNTPSHIGYIVKLPDTFYSSTYPYSHMVIIESNLEVIP